MTIRLIHKLLLIGIVSIILSFVFFGLNTNVYLSMLLPGIVVSGFSFMKVLFRHDSRKNKMCWTLIVLVAILFQWLSEPSLVRLSFWILFKRNEVVLSTVNKILLSKPGNATWVTDSALWQRNNITPDEGLRIESLLRNSQFYYVQKDSSRIYYMTFSRIDVTHGIVYYYHGNNPGMGTHLAGNWYH